MWLHNVRSPVWRKQTYAYQYIDCSSSVVPGAPLSAPSVVGARQEPHRTLGSTGPGATLHPLPYIEPLRVSSLLAVTAMVVTATAGVSGAMCARGAAAFGCFPSAGVCHTGNILVLFLLSIGVRTMLAPWKNQRLFICRSQQTINNQSQEPPARGAALASLSRALTLE